MIFAADHLVDIVLEGAPVPPEEIEAERRSLGDLWAKHPAFFRYFYADPAKAKG